MIVAVNTRFLLKEYLEGYGNFVREVFIRIAQNHPEHQFYFVFDRPFPLEWAFPINVKPVVVGPEARHPLLWYVWYQWQLPRYLKKWKADVFVSPDGFCSLRTRIPQCLVVHDLGFLHYPEGYKKSHLAFYRRNTPRFLRKAACIATVSEYTRQDIIRQYHIPPEKIRVVPNGVKQVFRPLTEEEREGVKQLYTGGNEYFLYVGSIHPRKNLIGLLKAFSLFKKRQRTAMKLVLAGRMAWKNDEFTALLQTYKYRHEVVLTGFLEDKELAGLMGAAYALVYPSLFEGFGVPIVEAMTCHVPVLTSMASAMEEIAGPAALYFDATEPTSIAQQLMTIYKDEDLRKSLIQKGTGQVTQYSWERSAALMWELVEHAADTIKNHR